jgi:hypothetical protein
MLPSLDASDISAASVALCTYVEAHRSLWSTLLTGGAASVFREELLRIAREVAVTRANPNAWVPPELAISFHVSGTVELLSWWLRQERPVSTRYVAELLQRVVLMPINEANRKFTGAGPAQSTAGKKRKSKSG